MDEKWAARVIKVLRRGPTREADKRLDRFIAGHTDQDCDWWENSGHDWCPRYTTTEPEMAFIELGLSAPDVISNPIGACIQAIGRYRMKMASRFPHLNPPVTLP